jgi:hypothetical protein
MRTAVSDRPVRVAIFGSVEDVTRAVQGLLGAGFKKEHVSVVCSDRAKEELFAEYEHEQPAGSTTPAAAGAGALIGGFTAGAAGLVAVSGLVATGGVGLVVVGPLLAGTGAAFGSFVGAMVSRGFEHEVANYYDQALPRGMILVAAEIDAHDDVALLERAERVFEESGAHPVALPHG